MPNPKPSAASQDDLYVGGSYGEINPDWHAEDSEWKALKVLQMLEKHQITPTTVCEVGCGAGEVLKQLHDRMGNQTSFVGYDVSPHALDLCKSRETTRLRFELSSGVAQIQGSYDLMLIIDLIEHLPDYLGFLRSAHPLASHQLFHVPLDLSVQTVLRSRPLSRLRTSVGHIHYFTKQTALESLMDTGYEIVDYFYTSPATELAPNSRLMRAAAVPRKLLFSLNQELAVRVMGGYSLIVLTR